MSTHVAIAAVAKGHFDEIRVPTEKPQHGEVLLKVEYASMVAFDTYITDLGYATDTFPMVLGSNAAGTVVELGPCVDDLKIGDRQEYSIQSRTVPDSMPLAAAATIPDHFVTHFPSLESPPLSSAPILIYGAGSTTGQYAIQLLHAAGYRNIIVTASPETPRISAGGDGKVTLAVDCITAEGTIAKVAKLISQTGTGTNVRGEGDAPMYIEIPEGRNPFPKSVNVHGVLTFQYQEDAFQKENVMPRILPELLEKGIIQPNRIHLLDQGTFKERVAVGLDLLRHNKVSGEKLVVKIEV
ncbi:chaperonin 10-like protein [Armillaria nabsnona]|nr:chaperonin 10-like protein [Armillaria nabsnona]